MSQISKQSEDAGQALDGPTTRQGQVERVAMEAAAVDSSPPPSRILILPWGEVKSAAGDFVVDEESIVAILAAFHEHETDLPVDYEHQTLGGPYSSPTGQAPAAGWIKSLSAIRPGSAEAGGDDAEPGLWAEVEWTADAAAKLSAREYRYLSPVALVRRTDRRVVGLHSAALTNKPAIVGMKPVVASDMALALPEGAREDALDRGESVKGEAWGELRRMLVMDESAAEDLILVAAAQRIRVLERSHLLREASQRVARAMGAGKLTPAQREWALTLAERSPAEFDRWEEAAPCVVPLGRMGAPISRQTAPDSRRGLAEQVARREWRLNRQFLDKLCTEDAYVAAAVRGAAS